MGGAVMAGGKKCQTQVLGLLNGHPGRQVMFIAERLQHRPQVVGIHHNDWQVYAQLVPVYIPHQGPAILLAIHPGPTDVSRDVGLAFTVNLQRSTFNYRSPGNRSLV